MRPWWLILGAIHGLGLREWDETHKQLQLLDDYERAARDAGRELEVIGYRQERQAVVGKFLEDPGYADEAGIWSIHALAPDIFTPHMLEQYQTLRWSTHLSWLWSTCATVRLPLAGLLRLLGSGPSEMRRRARSLTSPGARRRQSTPTDKRLSTGSAGPR